MKITFHGAARTVTGSQHLIEVNGHRILLDCGLYQGKRKLAFERNRQLPFAPESIDVLVLSHAHIDHSGNIPGLVKQGFNGDIICTSATRDLCAAMLLDSAHIQERDVEFVNRKRSKKGQAPFEPLYTQEDAVAAMQQFMSIAYHREKLILPGVYLTFVDAGHMLGSTSIILRIQDHEARQDVTLVFSGDIGRAGIPIIRDPEPLTGGADVLIMESTYGNRLHPPYPEADAELKRIVLETYQRGGQVIIPAFAVGRTQQLVYSLHKLFQNKDLPRIPIYVDSPLATNVTDVFRLHPEVYDDDIRAFMLQDDVQNPFGFANLSYTRSVDQSKELNFLREPAIIISASGMMEHGRILHHLRHRVADPRHTILVVGWQAPNTLGRYITDGVSPVRIFGEEYPVHAHVEKLDGFSGHADRDELLAWAGAMSKKPARTFLVHGEEEAALALADSLRSVTGFSGVDVPEMHQSFSINGGTA
ncbi:MAG: MBL fold metallo-hydrolase [Anaerolineae bacterium]|nr:MBL fold metallo-hydrolase [Anaerolineae bacterium]